MTVGSSALRRALVRVPFVALAVLAAGALAAPAGATTFSVAVGANGGFSYSPSQLTIQVGDTVTWTNDSGTPHNVTADDGSFRCANGCDDTGGHGSPTSSWTASRTFHDAGVIHYHCEVHGFAMAGTITVQAQATSPGAIRFAHATASVGEGAGHATIVVERSGGQDGAVSVQYATADGSGKAGVDYTAAGGTLTWADGDEADKSFTIPILNRHLTGPGKTVNLTLSSPTGGATLGSPSAAVLTILDNTGGSPGPGSPPAAPTSLHAEAQSTSSIQLDWSEASSGVTQFHVEQASLGGSFQEVDSVPGSTTTDLLTGLPASTFFNFRVRAENASGLSPYSNVAGAATDAVPAPCVAGPSTLCLGDGGRFKVEVAWATATDSGMGNAVTVPSAPDSGLFYFFNPGNIEMLVKVLNACSPPFNRYWVFFAATTNVRFTLTVTDTQKNNVKVYFNPLNQAAAPLQDTDAFATCP